MNQNMSPKSSQPKASISVRTSFQSPRQNEPPARESSESFTKCPTIWLLFDGVGGRMKLSIKLGNAISEVEIDDSATVRQLKKHLSAIHGCKVSQCRLVYAARALRNDSALSSLSLSQTKPITLIIEGEVGTRASPSDTAFLAAINEPGLAGRLNQPEILELIERLRTQLTELGSPEYADAIRRLGLIPPYDPHRVEQLEEAQFGRALAHMEEIGFADRATNLAALRKAEGDPYRAIEWMIDNGQLS
jgi:hypothetical protein